MNILYAYSVVYIYIYVTFNILYVYRDLRVTSCIVMHIMYNDIVDKLIFIIFECYLFKISYNF